jgi:putative endonuclease
MGVRRHDPARLGRHGEDLAATWYEQRGYTVLERNWRCREGELDLVLGNGDLIVICEVKTRSSDRFGSPFEAVGRTKQLRLRRLAARWLRERAPFRPATVRFDVAGVVGGRVEVVESAL